MAGFYYRNLHSQEVDPETIHFPTKVDDVVLFRLGLSSKHLFFSMQLWTCSPLKSKSVWNMLGHTLWNLYAPTWWLRHAVIL